MARYAALLRGVNVGGTRLAMADLRRLVTELGHEDVTTYLQSGNVVFSSPPTKDSTLAEGIAEKLADEVGLRVPVLVRSGGELAAVADASPYAGRQDDPTRVLVAFLSAAPTAARVKELTVPAGEHVEYEVTGREVHLHFPDGGYGRTKFTNAYLEKRLGVVATTRNWKSVLALRDLTAD
ncbi:DUF1697 domain-containing protein [Micromonospora auratinigra]|uniref:Uncharacterized conserved protein, DUF1697 family n=1 Tax=Micromonospora auratinigra TaxID=261654 RepID=A0A1A9A7T6_9ACTN|nr:DUF1697 domain-containing protein [Micromonospora auratinigra]SBT52540.1 Uncharacterized conserved protein, DUF1697 family [Micromonospora auratinigra]